MLGRFVSWVCTSIQSVFDRSSDQRERLSLIRAEARTGSRAVSALLNRFLSNTLSCLNRSSDLRERLSLIRAETRTGLRAVSALLNRFLSNTLSCLNRSSDLRERLSLIRAETRTGSRSVSALLNQILSNTFGCLSRSSDQRERLSLLRAVARTGSRAVPLLWISVASADFRAGAVVVDVTPPVLPVLVNGGMTSRTLDKVNSRINARAIAMTDGTTQVAIVVVDSCMMSRDVLDDVKALAATKTGIGSDRILISATHSHSAPASMGCLGTDADPEYTLFLKQKLVDTIAAVQKVMVPARIGFAKRDAAEFTALRQWIRRPD
ncbi:MAG: hypothetical protein FJ267_09570, partial [Planctomycetes bacterium]|nr:hypothetical protein [Planctomycetota bacterium]